MSAPASPNDDADDERAEDGAVVDEADDPDDVDEEDAPPSEYPAPDPRHAIAAAVGMTVAVGAAFTTSIAFGRVAFAILAVAFGGIAVFGVVRSRTEGRAHSLRLKSGDLTLSDARPGLRATLTIPARAAHGDRLAVQTPDVPQKVA